MIKKWTHINNVLNIEGIEAEDSAKDCTISKEQMQKIEDKMAADANSIHDKDEALTKPRMKDGFGRQGQGTRKERDDLKDKVKDLEDQPGGSTSTAVEDTKAQDYFSGQVFDAINQFA